MPLFEFYIEKIKKIYYFFFSVPFIRDGIIATTRITKDKLNTAKPLQNIRILEIGCGAGILTEVCKVPTTSYFEIQRIHFIF